MNHRFRLIFLLLTSMWTASYCGAASVSLPLGGVYRAGKYMPVQIVADNDRGTISLSATGAMKTSVTVLPSTRIVAPWLILSETIQDAAWTDSAGQRHEMSSTLHPLSENDCLVALVGADAKFAQFIFPTAHIVPIAPEAGWIPEPAAAWEALDAIVVSEQNLPALQQSIDALLTNGTMIAVVAASAPAMHHEDWVQAGPIWWLQRRPLIAHEPINAEAYGPTYDWIRGRPALDRARVLLLAIILGIAVVSISLWRSRWAVWAIAAVCIAGGGVVFAYDRERPKMLQLRLGISADSQLDAWTWYSPISSAEAHHPFTGLAKPVFASRGQARDLDVLLNWADDPSQRSFDFHLDRNQSLAFVDALPAPAIDNVKQELLPDAKDFGEHLYLRTGDHLAGTAIIPQNGPLTTVVIDRPHSSTPK